MRWKILALLFFARLSMAFQFGSIGAISPIYETTFSVSNAQVGFLIGLYFLPGLFFAIPGGSLANWIGDKRITVIGLGLMLTGAIAMALFQSWEVQIAGRVVAGVGGIAVHVLLTKMIADWFAENELATALGLFANSWPAGIALALVVMPLVASFSGLAGTIWFISLMVTLALVLFALFYQSPPRQSLTPAPAGRAPRGWALGAVISAGLAWGLFNSAFGMVFNFGPVNLVDRGFNLVEASAMVSIVVWVTMFAGFSGGLIADRTGRPLTVLFGALIANVLGLLAFPYVDQIVLLAVFLGIATGLPVGVYLTLATRPLQPEERAIGIGIYFTLYYLIFTTTPGLAGALMDHSGRSSTAFLFGGGLLVLGSVFATLWIGLNRRANLAKRDGRI